MTAVASPPSVQPLPRWDAGQNGGESLDAMTSEEVSRMFMPHKPASRPTSVANQLPSAPPTQSAPRRSNPSEPVPQVNGESASTNGEDNGWGPRKKAAKFWPNPKADSVIGLSRGQPLPTPSSGQSAASTINSALQQSTAGIPTQLQTNGIKTDHTSAQQAILALHPLTDTFQRKHIQVPFSPEVQKIGRQTNQKTVPAANNGYFDSKVLSRQHAEIWADRNGKIWIKDVKSSNGTFVNGLRLSQENKESDPHELKEGDTLELGIDIVSEDQKSIVHHKVSARVDLAGLYNNASNILDMMHIDPNTGQPIINDPNQQMQLRGRGGSQGSIGAISRVGSAVNLSGNAGLMGPQRQVNMWMAPITIEQVVKKLTTELKQAKQQAHELHRTEDFFTSLLNPQEGQEPPKLQPKRSDEQQPKYNPPALPIDHSSTFHEPPAPPPSLPLPEKPDTAAMAPFKEPLPNAGLKRTETERPPFSPARPEQQDSQILTLLDALKSAKAEISSQGERMLYLEHALQRERKAREIAESRARALGYQPADDSEASGQADHTLEAPLDSLELIEQDLPNGHIEKPGHVNAHLSTSSSMETLRDPDIPTEASDLANVGARYELLKGELEQMKLMMETYKRKAEEAEASQRRFAELVESVRNDRVPGGEKSRSGPSSLRSSAGAFKGGDDGANHTPASAHLLPNHVSGEADGPDTNLLKGDDHQDTPPAHHLNGAPVSAAAAAKLPQDLERSLSKVLQAQKLIDRHTNDGLPWTHSTPYVSMIGVVLIGVGIMTWLNGLPAPGGAGGGGKVLE